MGWWRGGFGRWFRVELLGHRMELVLSFGVSLLQVELYSRGMGLVMVDGGLMKWLKWWW